MASLASVPAQHPKDALWPAEGAHDPSSPLQSSSFTHHTPHNTRGQQGWYRCWLFLYPSTPMVGADQKADLTHQGD